MIVDTLENAARYAALHPLFARAFEYLAAADWPALADGRIELDGQRLFVLLARGEGVGRDRARIEAHRRYIDIQYLIAGHEEIGWRTLASCQQVTEPYDTSRDIAFYADPPQAWLSLVPGQFAIFHPDDAHAPLAGQGSQRKAVVKVAVS